MMNWSWTNHTKVFFGQGAVKQHVKDFISPNSTVVCIFGGTSVDKNGSRKDVQESLEELKCEVSWFGGVEANPEYETLLKILAKMKALPQKVDWIVAIGGGSVIDGSKFISVAYNLPSNVEPWSIFSESVFPESAVKLCTISTLPASGSEWNPNFCVDRRATRQKVGNRHQMTFPIVSLLDPRYTMTLPVRQLRNGVFDSICHCIDKYLVPDPTEHPLADDLYIAVVKELVTIGPDVIKPDSPIELRARLITASEYAMNGSLQLTVVPCVALHGIALALTVYYGIDHGATLAIIAVPFYRQQLPFRKELMAKTAEGVWGERVKGTVDEKAKQFVELLEAFLKKLGLPLKASDWPGVVVKPGDVEAITDLVMEGKGNKPFGWHQTITREVVHEVLSHCIC